MTLFIYILLGSIMGLTSGLFGIGGGVVLVPGLVFLLGFEIKKATAISLAVIVPIAISGAGKHIQQGTLELRDLKSVLFISIGGIVCTILGVWLNSILPASTLRKLFGILMIVLGMKLFFSKAKEPQPESPRGALSAAAGASGAEGLPIEDAGEAGPRSDASAQ